jgi:phenylacetate-coenzyme A ligase PaaK-like adenylate-forming protein/O-antigen/teichoic acid export membrane protein
VSVLRHLPRFRAAYRELDTLQSHETWTRTEIEAFQLERLNGVWREAVGRVPHYRRQQASLALPTEFASLDEFRRAVPVLRAEAVRAGPREFLSETGRPGRWELTGGSTGLPARFYWAHAARLAMLRTMYRFLAQWGADIFDPMVYLWGHGASFAPGLRGWIARLGRPVEDRLRNRLRLSAYRTDPRQLRTYLDRIAAFRPLSIYAYSTSAALLAQEAEAAGFHCDTLKFVVLTAEPALPQIVRTVQRAFGTPAIVLYGSTDCGLMAHEWPDRTLRVREDRVILETLARNDGRFDLVVTVLDNPSFPLVRYAIGDVTDFPLETPDCGFAVLRNVAGRCNDLILSRAGRHVHPTLLNEVIECDAAIRCYRVHQRADGSLSVALQLTGPGATVDTARLRKRIARLADGYPVAVEVVDAIPRTPAGKHRWIVSELAGAGQGMRAVGATGILPVPNAGQGAEGLRMRSLGNLPHGTGKMPVAPEENPGETAAGGSVCQGNLPSPPAPLPQAGEERLRLPSPPAPLPQAGEGRRLPPSPITRLPQAGKGNQRATARTVAFALTDQALVSGTRFVTTIFLARAAGSNELGLYALGLTVLLLAACVQESLIMVPYTLSGNRLRGRRLAECAGAALLQHAVLSLLAVLGLAATACGFFAVPGLRQYVPLLAVLAAVLPLASLWEFGRRFAFAHLNMAAAMTMDAVVAAAQLSALSALAVGGMLSARTAMVVVGASCAVGGLGWLISARSRFAWRRESIARELRQSWSLGKWLFAGQVASALHGYSIRWVLAVACGVAATGVYSACMTVVTFVQPLLIGIGNLLAPSVARALADGGPARVHEVIRRTALFTGGAVTLFCTAVFLFGDRLLVLLYGTDFAGYGPILRVLAIGMLASAMEGVAYDGLWAIGRAAANFWISLIGLAATLGLAAALVGASGVLGGAYGWLGGVAVMSALRYVLLFWPDTPCREGAEA